MIGWAIGGIEREILLTRERLSALTTQAAQLRGRLGARGASKSAAAAVSADEAAVTGRTRRRRKMSPEVRKRISEAMTKRWAERKRGK